MLKKKSEATDSGYREPKRPNVPEFRKKWAQVFRVLAFFRKTGPRAQGAGVHVCQEAPQGAHSAGAGPGLL